MELNKYIEVIDRCGYFLEGFGPCFNPGDFLKMLFGGFGVVPELGILGFLFLFLYLN